MLSVDHDFFHALNFMTNVEHDVFIKSSAWGQQTNSSYLLVNCIVTKLIHRLEIYNDIVRIG